MSIKRLTSILSTCILIVAIQLTLGWKTTYIVYLFTFPLASLIGLLTLNTVVLYIYLKYFVSPHGRKKVDRFKPLRFTHKTIWPRLEQLRVSDNTANKPVLTENEEIQQSFDQLMEYIIRDFISSWFVKITGTMKEESFPLAVDHIIRACAVEISKRIQNIDLLSLVINKLIPKMTWHISEFRIAETSLRGKSLERSVTQSDELDLLLASRFKSGKLHAALTTAAVTTKPTEIVYLRQMMERVLPLIIEKKELSSGPVRVVVREIVSNSILQPILDMLADPDFWNQTIDSYLGKAIIEQKMVRQLREVLNRHSTNEIDQKDLMNIFQMDHTTDDDDNDDENHLLTRSTSEILFQKQKMYMGKGSYQDFLKMIAEEKNLLDLKRVRNDIVTQIRKKKAQITDRDPEEVMDGEKVQDIMMYITRLSTAKKRVDKRIAALSGEQFDFRKSTVQLFGSGSSRRKQNTTTALGSRYNLKEILGNTSGLSYFMEFMDRRGDMVKLQFWLMVEGFHSTEINTEQEQLTFLQDVKMVYDMYFIEKSPHKLNINDQLHADLKNAISLAEQQQDTDGFENQIRELRLRLYQIQQHVFWEIEKEHYPYFKRSDLYFKFLASAPKKEEEEQEGRRSLDETTLYQQDPIIKYESDSEISVKRGHQRALSDSISSKFLSFSNMFNPSVIRTNTVDAVEAELRSILDANSVRPSLSASLLLRNNIKSTTAIPVQNAYALPSWTSSGGTNTISEIEHDSLESFIPANSTQVAPPKSVDDHTSNVHFAPPGDLMLSSKVQQLSEEVEKLIAQEAIVDALIAKAETQNKLEELRILKKSKSMFRQELQQLEYQKSQYELQESENVLLPNRTQLNITSSTIGSDKHGDFALYVIEIQQLGLDGNFASGWIVARRYSEFFALHQKLKEIYPIVKLIEFPAKWPLLKLQKPFVETRRISLEKYLLRLIKEEEICKSQELRSFLSQQNIFIPAPDTEWPFGSLFHPQLKSSNSTSSLQSLNTTTSPSIKNLQKSIANETQQQQPKGFMRHIYKTVAAGIDDILIGPSMLDLITQRLGEQLVELDDDTKSLSPPASSSSSKSHKLDDSLLSDSMHQSTTDDGLKAEGITRFTEPLCDLFIEMFELKDKTNWLRRQAVVIILQQILEGTIERKLRESLKYLSSSSMIAFYFNKSTASLWPNGILTFKSPRKAEEKLVTREEANRKLSTWLPDLLGNMVGRQNARKGARRLFTVLQNKRLNQDLVYTLLDEVVLALFPELTSIAK